MHGIESLCDNWVDKKRKKDGTFSKITRKIQPPTIVRYADDFVVLHPESRMIPHFQKQIEDWLKDFGLELKPSKTRVTDTAEGFNFLGFSIRQYKVGAYRSARITGYGGTTNLGFKTLTKPSKKAIKEHLKKIEQVIDIHRTAPQAALINKLNPIIRGWCNYYDAVVSKEIFQHCDNQMYLKLKSWAKRRCPNTNAHDTVRNYWHTIGDRNWAFSTKDGLELIQHVKTKIVRHVKIQGARSPYDGDSIYWGLRLSESKDLTGREQKLLKIQKGKCPHCNHEFKHGDRMEVDHIKLRSLGGRDVYSNLQLLHRDCHIAKTRTDGSRDGNKGELKLF